MEESSGGSENQSTGANNAPAWKPLTAKQRRVLGTLMEKSKTTPDAYPMSFQGLMTGCNQKSNRAPITNFTVEQVESIVDELRSLGAVTIVQGSGRVTKVRHFAYNWLGLNKVEGAVMTELLLRGEQTLGELRIRATRMEPIEELEDLKKILDDLKGRNLVVELTPAGRGQLVSHNLYPEWELEQLQKAVATNTSLQAESEESEQKPRSVGSGGVDSRLARIESELQELRETTAKLAARLAELDGL